MDNKKAFKTLTPPKNSLPLNKKVAHFMGRMYRAGETLYFSHWQYIFLYRRKDRWARAAKYRKRRGRL